MRQKLAEIEREWREKGEAEVSALKAEIVRLRGLSEGSASSLAARQRLAGGEVQKDSLNLLNSQLEFMTKMNQELKTELSELGVKQKSRLASLEKDL